MSDFMLNYKNAVEMLEIPELSKETLTSDTEHKVRAKKLLNYRIAGLMFALLIMTIVMLASATGVYACRQLWRTVHHTDSGIAVTASEELYDGGLIKHNYEPKEDDNCTVTGIQEEIITEEIPEQLNFSSWEEAAAYVSFDIASPDIDYPVSIYVWPKENLVEAVCGFNGSEFYIRYRYYNNTDWDFETEYAGEITERSSYVNKYGDVFSETSVLIDDDTYVHLYAAFEHYLIHLEFKNTDLSEIHLVADALNLGCCKQ